MFGEKKGNKPLLTLSSPASYPSIETGEKKIRLGVFWLFVMFAESQIKASEKRPRILLKMVVKRCSWGGNL